ncbi:hypothetical protein JT059_04755 [Helicobacter pylori]|nr:hypothetical protein [Helicobacter pylori]
MPYNQNHAFKLTNPSPTHSKQKTSLILNVNDTDCPQPNSNNTSLD